MKKAIGTFCLLFSIVLWLFPFISNVDFLWNVIDSSWEFDLLVSSLYFALFLTGLSLLFYKRTDRVNVTLLAGIFFVFYQLAHMGLHRDHRYTSRCRINDALEVNFLIRDGGAFTKTSRAYLWLQETKYIIFVANHTIKTYKNILSGRIESCSDGVLVNLRTMDGKKIADSVPINGFMSKGQRPR